MDAAQATSLVLEEIQAGGQDYPTEGLAAERFYGGWFVYAPVMVADSGVGVGTRSVFLVGESGRVKEVTSDGPADAAREWFMEACLWFSAEEPDLGQADSSLPSHPDLNRFARPRAPADYDRAAVTALGAALTHERDFAGWLADRLRELGDLVGGGGLLVSRRPTSWAAGHLRELIEPHADDADPTVLWQTWPAVEPAGLPAVDIAGWLLVPGVRTREFLESLEAETPAATRLADAVADRANQAPPWRACGVAELLPQLVALRRTDEFDADLDAIRRLIAADGDTDFLDTLFVSPGEADVDALLRIAVDADQREVIDIDIDVAAAAAYRRVLDRLDVPFENYWYEAMVE
jgi:hypothetical protein